MSRTALCVSLPLVFTVALLSGCAPAPEEPPSLVGDWAGWAYGDGDFPLRLHVETTEDGELAVAMDYPHAELWRLPVSSIDAGADRVRFERLNSEGGRWVFEGEISGDDIAGEVHFDGERFGDFELHRSAEPLPVVPPAEFADCAGIYRFEGARSVVVTARFWGDLVFFDTNTGRKGTLFPTGPGSFFAGSALYVPAPISARVDCLRNEAGEVAGLRWTPAAESATEGVRMHFEDEEVEFKSRGEVLSGTLIRPPGPGPHPAVIVLGGSGWSSRSSIRWDADILASQGIAALIYDKRGFGESEGEQTVSFSDTADDALAALQFLKARADLDPGRIGLTGTSRGGWLAPLAASRTSDFAFLVLFVAPAVSPAEQETTRRLNLLREEGASEDEIATAEDYLGRMWRYARNKEGWDDLVAASQEMDARGWLEILEEPGTEDSEDWAWARLNMHYDPLPVLRKVQTPVLALFGELDRNVVPEINRPLMEQALLEGSNPDVTLMVIPGADHGLRPASGQRLPYHRTVGFAPEVWSTVFEWLDQRLGERR